MGKQTAYSASQACGHGLWPVATQPQGSLICRFSGLHLRNPNIYTNFHQEFPWEYVDYGGGDQLPRHRLWLLAAVWLQAKVSDRGLGLRPRLYAGSVCDNSAAEAAYAAIVALHKYTLPLFLGMGSYLPVSSCR